MSSIPLSATFSTLQRLQREYTSVGEGLLKAEARISDMERRIAVEFSEASPGAGILSEQSDILRELSRLKARRAILRLTGGEQNQEIVLLDEQIRRFELDIQQLHNNPLDDPTLIGSNELGTMLVEMEELAEETKTLRARRDDLERRIGIFQAWAFEEVPEPVASSFAPPIAAVLSPNAPPREIFRMLRTKVQTLDEERPFRCFGVVSAGPGEGKTTAAISLALSFAQDGSRVLLVEADLRRPRVENYLGLPRRVGLGDWLRGSAGPARLRRIEPYGLSLLTAGAPVSQASELLGSGRMAQLMEVARQSFDFIIVDCPPPFPFADSVILQELLDGFLFVVRARHAPRETIQASLPHLRAELIRGVVFNDHREILPRLYSRGAVTYRTYEP